MQADRWQRVEALFQSALEHPQQDRAAFLARVCPDDAEVRGEVQSLLNVAAAHSSRESTPISEILGRQIASGRSTDFRASMVSPGSGVSNAVHPGETILHYRILQKIGSGGMGEVYRAEDLKLRRTVAVKVLAASAHTSEKSRRRLLNEARSASALNHPNIVTIHAIEQVDSAEPLDFIVMEYVDGCSLSEQIRQGPLDLPLIADMGVQAADALAAAHEAGIVHRDIKPSNIAITTRGQVKVLDFGLAKVVPVVDLQDALEGQSTSLESLTSKGIIVGTVAYMSPEQTRGEPLDARSDIFSLGCVLYEAATGLPHFGDQAFSPSGTRSPKSAQHPRVPCGRIFRGSSI